MGRNGCFVSFNLFFKVLFSNFRWSSWFLFLFLGISFWLGLFVIVVSCYIRIFYIGLEVSSFIVFSW